ncbi:MAG: penicillin-binding transpeptidase domain-containing protein [Candidatus Acidiferrales bacterium]
MASDWGGKRGQKIMRSHRLGLLPIILLLLSPLYPASYRPVFAGAAPATPHIFKHRRTVNSSNGVPTFADSAKDDDAANDDPIVRQAAVRALGRYNGAVVAIDPTNGRILSIVNQKLVFSAGFKPCSTIKPVIAVAALQEGVVTRDTMIRVSRRKSLNLTEALAHSNNAYFEELGRRMGFDVVSDYARKLGLGEPAGYDIAEEQPGALPVGPPRRGGVARMSSFGEGIQMTPLQLGALVSTIANRGTLYYLQYPRTEEEKENFEPRVKRSFEFEPMLQDVRQGMLAAVEYGTARRSYISNDEQASGKTGSCSDAGSRLGWFVSFADQINPKIVLVILMRGTSHAVRGPIAAGIAGNIYRRLNDEQYFASRRTEPAVLGAASVAKQLPDPVIDAPPNADLLQVSAH